MPGRLSIAISGRACLPGLALRELDQPRDPLGLVSNLVVATLDMARVIVIESALSFLGLGVQPPTPTWGGMLADGRVYLSTAWWLATFPGLAILITVLGINLFGDGLRDTLDPRLKV